MVCQELPSLIWSVSDLLRGDYKQSEYGLVILPFTILRRLDCIIESAKPNWADKLHGDAETGGRTNAPLSDIAIMFRNTYLLNLKKLSDDVSNIRESLVANVQAFPLPVREIFERFDFFTQIERLAKANLLFPVVQFFISINLNVDVVNDLQMGGVFEELISKFAEISTEVVGEHFTPREVVQLMVRVLLADDRDLIACGDSVERTMYDPTAGTGGMLSIASEYILKSHPKSRLSMFGQEINDEFYAICKAAMLMRGQDVNNIVSGNSLSEDGFSSNKFDYMLCHPPFGVEWKKIEKIIRQEHEQKEFDGRFGPGLPRLSDGTMLFLMSLIHKMKSPLDGGSRICIIVTDSVLRSGGVLSGESEIRKWIVESDLLDCIIALPTDIFSNTSIQSYVLVIDNNKKRNGIKLVNASGLWELTKTQVGSKRRRISEEGIEKIVKLYSDVGGDYVKVVAKRDLLYRNFRTEIGGNLISRNVSLNQNEADYLRLTKSFGIDVKNEKSQEVGCEIDFFSFFSNDEAKWASTLPLVALVEPCNINDGWDFAIKMSGIVFKSSWDGRADIANFKLFKVRRNVILPRYLEIYIEERSIKEVGTSKKIPGIKANLEIRIECPSLKKQQAIVDFYNQKAEFAIRLARVEQEQWGDSVDICIFKHRVGEYGSSVEYMMKIFPHPLASLLFKIQCSREKRDELDGYRVFFECLGAFLSSIALGVIYESKTERDCFDILVNRKRLTNPTMGSYQNIIRKSRERGSDIVGFGSYVLSVVASSDVEDILTSCTNIRNEIAHRGLINSSESSEYIDKFRKLLSRVSNVLGDFFSENFIAKQLHQKWNGQVFENEVLSLTGIASYPFERRTKDSLRPLISGELYLFQSVGERDGVERNIRLFHFVRCIEIVDGSDNEGFYFLNSFERNETDTKTIFQFSAFQPLIESRKIIASEMLERIHALK